MTRGSILFRVLKAVFMPRCPSCFVIMTDVMEGNFHVKTCSSCFGEWVSRPALMHLVRTPPPIAAEPADAPSGQSPASTDATSPPVGAPPDLRSLAALAVESDTKKPMQCPDCHVQMTIDRLNPLIPVPIQICKKCSGAWLDVGKRPLLQRLYYELTNSQDPKIIALRDKLGIANMNMQADLDAMRSTQTHLQNVFSPGGIGSMGGYGGSIFSGLPGLMDYLGY